MKAVKIIFFDIDGTLVDMKTKRMTENTRVLLRRLKEKGILLCMATGRGPMTLPDTEGIAFDAYLTFNGSYCYEDGGVLFSHPIPREDVHKIIANAASIGRPVSVATKDVLAANGKDRDLEDYYAIAGIDVKIAEDFDQIAQEEIYQIMLGCRQEEYPALLNGVQGAKIAAWWPRAADVIPACGGKGIAVRKILEHYRIGREEAMAFGDGGNDIEMLEAVGWGVAMGNASQAVKDAADDVCGSVDSDGVYAYCVRHGLI